jgi:SH3-like domain-containing protein
MMKNNALFLLTFFILATLLPIKNSYSFKKPVITDYYASLRATKTNVRAGPGTSYPIKFIFKMAGIPVRVISEYDNWSEIEDYDGESGWIAQSLITKKRMVIVKSKESVIKMHLKPSKKARIVAKLQNNVVGKLLKCNKNWCGIKVEGSKGWVAKDDIWGE